ncbi:MAG: succinate dehydrogenase, hydrophobic membrane anchor protein [Alphaproteobacteria bacterium]|nr:succinate dehydrogenase, hydrophobic membrane anchor protein [Alphaproteobacteria bacterium]
MKSNHLRSPLANVRGLGSAKEGLHHWWLQRLTSIALIPLSLWFMVVVVTKLIDASRIEVADWFASPYVALLMLGFLLTLLIHCKLGIQVVIEDYVHREPAKLTLLLTNTFVSVVLGCAVLFSIAKLHFIGI